MYFHINLQLVNSRFVRKRHQSKAKFAINSLRFDYERFIGAYCKKCVRYGKIYVNWLQKQSYQINFNEQIIIKIALHIYH